MAVPKMMVLSRRHSRNLLAKRKARQTTWNVTNATRKGSRSGTVMRNTANIVECPRRASLELGYTTKRLLKINEASHLLHTKNKMAAPVAAQQQRINNEETTSRQIDHTAPAHGARQGVRWKLLEKRVLCHVTGTPSTTFGRSVSCGQKCPRVACTWCQSLSESGSRVVEGTDCRDTGLDTGPHQGRLVTGKGKPKYIRSFKDASHSSSTHSMERTQPSQLCPRGWHGKDTPQTKGSCQRRKRGDAETAHLTRQCRAGRPSIWKSSTITMRRAGTTSRRLLELHRKGYQRPQHYSRDDDRGACVDTKGSVQDDGAAHAR